MGSDLRWFVEQNAEVFIASVLPSLQILEVRNLSCTCKTLHNAVHRAPAAVWDRITHSSWLAVHTNISQGKIRQSHHHIERPNPCAVSMDGKLLAEICRGELLISHGPLHQSQQSSRQDIVPPRAVHLARLPLPAYDKVITWTFCHSASRLPAGMQRCLDLQAWT